MPRWSSSTLFSVDWALSSILQLARPMPLLLFGDKVQQLWDAVGHWSRSQVAKLPCLTATSCLSLLFINTSTSAPFLRRHTPWMLRSPLALVLLLLPLPGWPDLSCVIADCLYNDESNCFMHWSARNFSLDWVPGPPLLPSNWRLWRQPTSDFFAVWLDGRLMAPLPRLPRFWSRWTPLEWEPALPLIDSYMPASSFRLDRSCYRTCCMWRIVCFKALGLPDFAKILTGLILFDLDSFLLDFLRTWPRLSTFGKIPWRHGSVMSNRPTDEPSCRKLWWWTFRPSIANHWLPYEKLGERMRPLTVLLATVLLAPPRDWLPTGGWHMTIGRQNTPLWLEQPVLLAWSSCGPLTVWLCTLHTSHEMVEATGATRNFSNVAFKLIIAIRRCRPRSVEPIEEKRSKRLALCSRRPLCRLELFIIQYWLEEQRKCLDDMGPVSVPPNEEAMYVEVVDALNACVEDWLAHFHDVDGSSPPLHDRWLAALCDYPPEFHDWICDLTSDWGEHILPDLIAGFIDGEAEAVAEEQFYSFRLMLPRFQQLDRLCFIKNHLVRALREDSPMAEPHRPVRGGPGGSISSPSVDQVPSRFRDQSTWQQRFRDIRWQDLPPDGSPPAVLPPPNMKVDPTFIFVHLFAGRRRQGEFHSQMAKWATARGVKVLILSLDTAIDHDDGNLSVRGTTWPILAEHYRLGRITGTLTGSPCETFTEARFAEPPPDWQGPPWPRPLRSFDRLFGLQDLTMKELRQAWAGSLFFLQVMYAASCHLARGGYLIAEHPARPRQADRPSIWTAALTELLRRHPEAYLHHFDQYFFGAASIKPTGLLAVNLPNFRREMVAAADWTAPRPNGYGYWTGRRR